MKQLLVAFLLMGAAINTQAQNTTTAHNNTNNLHSHFTYAKYQQQTAFVQHVNSMQKQQITELLTDEQKEKIKTIQTKAVLAINATTLVQQNSNTTEKSTLASTKTELNQIKKIEKSNNLSTTEKLMAIDGVLDNYIATIGITLDTQQLEALYN